MFLMTVSIFLPVIWTAAIMIAQSFGYKFSGTFLNFVSFANLVTPAISYLFLYYYYDRAKSWIVLIFKRKKF